MSAERITAWSAVVLGLVVLLPSNVLAHCDSLDGPVVTAARKALETADPAPALIWVRAEDEAEIRIVFAETLAVRGLSPRARELADRYFFETLVRVHRAGEGASYTGLKPAGGDLGPAIAAADSAIDHGALEPVVTLLADTMQEGLRRHLHEVVASKAFNAQDLAAGRAYVKAYVEFIHYVERLYETMIDSAEGHFADAE
jgi:hypothetical protein